MAAAVATAVVAAAATAAAATTAGDRGLALHPQHIFQ